MTWIWGLDTASTRWHAVGLNLESGEIKLRCCPEEKPKPKPAKGADEQRIRLIRAFAEFTSALTEGDLQCDLLVCEETLALPKNGDTTRKLNLAAGALYGVWVLRGGGMWYWCNVSTWKALIGVKGGGGSKVQKERIKEQCLEHGLVPDEMEAEFDAQPDYYDARALAHWGADFYARATIS